MENMIILPVYKTESHLMILKIFWGFLKGAFFVYLFLFVFISLLFKYFQNALKIPVHLCCCMSNDSEQNILRSGEYPVQEWWIILILQFLQFVCFTYTELWKAFFKIIIASLVNSCEAMKKLISFVSTWKWMLLFYIYN